MLGKTNANLIKNESNKVNLFDSDLLTLKRCEILNANKNTLVLKGTSADGYHADYSIDGSVNKMKMLSFSCKMQSSFGTSEISIEADDGNILYSFNESDNEGLVSLNIPIEYDYMEIRFYCHSNSSSIQESTFTDIYIGIEDKDVLLTGTALAEQVLEGRTFYSMDTNNKMLGTMPNNNAVSKLFTPTTSSQNYTIPKGYHNGNGKVTVSAIATQTKTVTPSKSIQTVTPDSGKYLSKVTVNAIPLINVLQYGNFNNTTNQNITITKSVTNGYLIVSACKDNIGNLFALAKRVSGSVSLTEMTVLTEIYPNSARGGMSIYQITASVNAVINIYSNNDNSTNPNSASGFIWTILGF